MAAHEIPTDWDIPVGELKWRIQHARQDSNQALYVAYPDARTVAKHLDRVFGWFAWSDSYRVLEASSMKEAGVECTIEIVTETGIVVRKTGFGTPTDIEAWKGAESDAFKRAAAKLGVGRNVYELEQVWAEYEKRGNKPAKPRGIEPKLVKLALGSQQQAPQPAAATPPQTVQTAPVEQASTNEVPDDRWNMYLDLMGSLSGDAKKIVAEWWGAHGDKRPRPLRDINRATFDKLLERIQIAAMEGQETDEAPW